MDSLEREVSVMHNFVEVMYEIPIGFLCIAIVFCCVLWIISAYFYMKKTWWRILNATVFIVTFVMVIMITLLYRESEKKGVFLIPFFGFSAAKQHHDIYNQMVLNVVLFFPFGLSLPFCICTVFKHPVVFSIVFALILSVIIEVLQYVFACGYSELDDVMLNTIGAACGASAYLIACLANKKWQKGRIKVG